MELHGTQLNPTYLMVVVERLLLILNNVLIYLKLLILVQPEF